MLDALCNTERDVTTACYFHIAKMILLISSQYENKRLWRYHFYSMNWTQYFTAGKVINSFYIPAPILKNNEFFTHTILTLNFFELEKVILFQFNILLLHAICRWRDHFYSLNILLPVLKFKRWEFLLSMLYVTRARCQ